MDYFELSRSLEKHHVLFYSIWNLGEPRFTNEIKTAAVAFDSEGNTIDFLFNQDYWDQLNDYERIFVICHECLHVILNHGFRIRQLKEKSDRDASNVALDIVVNHMLVNRFGFDRSKISNQDKLCWVDTVFPDMPVLDDDCFEYYYNLLPRVDLKLNCVLVDDHEGLTGAEEEILGPIFDTLSEEEKESVQDFLGKHFQEEQIAGCKSGGLSQFASVGKTKTKKKWESVIKKWALKYDKEEFHDVEQWSRMSRRFSMLSDDLMLPSEMEQEFELEGRIDVWFFQDTSGSCANFRDRFFKVALTLNPNRFNVYMHCFDTEVYETTLESKKLFGFGGTRFQPIEDFIQNKIKTDKISYPEAVFVITDGLGSPVKPEKTKNWYWFLSSPNYSYIPKDSHKYDLKEFE